MNPSFYDRAESAATDGTSFSDTKGATDKVGDINQSRSECTDTFETAKNGHLKCLKYLHKNGCPWDEDACAYASKNGHLECLRHLHENECPCAAEKYGHLMCPYCRAPILTPSDLLKEAILEQKEKLDFLFKVFIIFMLLWSFLFVLFLMKTSPLAPWVKPPPPANASFVNSFVRS